MKASSSVPAVVSAMKWFSNGLKAEDREDQFQNFWSVLELLAPLHKGALESTLKCPHCKSDLFCNHCQKVPQIRASASEGVKHLVQHMVTNEPDKFFRIINRTRNLLFHTVPMEKIEQELKISFSSLVEDMARVSRLAILNSINMGSPAQADMKLEMIEVGGVVHKIMVQKASITIAAGQNTIDQLPDTKIELISSDPSGNRKGTNAGILKHKQPTDK